MKSLGKIAVISLALLSIADIALAGPTFTKPPGLPLSASSNAGGEALTFQEGGGMGVQPVVLFNAPATAVAGDVVILKDAAGSHAPSNFAAVINFFNPADPAGSRGLAATHYKTYYGHNVGRKTFDNLKLFPNTIYVPRSAAATPNPAGIQADYAVLGPEGVVPAGQRGVIVVQAVPQPGIPSVVPEPATWAMMLGGIVVLGFWLRYLRRQARLLAWRATDEVN